MIENIRQNEGDIKYRRRERERERERENPMNFKSMLLLLREWMRQTKKEYEEEGLQDSIVALLQTRS